MYAHMTVRSLWTNEREELQYNTTTRIQIARAHIRLLLFSVVCKNQARIRRIHIFVEGVNRYTRGS